MLNQAPSGAGFVSHQSDDATSVTDSQTSFVCTASKLLTQIRSQLYKVDVLSISALHESCELRPIAALFVQHNEL